MSRLSREAPAHCQPLGNFVEALESLAPTFLAESWDNVGLLCGAPGQPIGRVLLCNDFDERVEQEARGLGPLGELLIVAYHPPWFQPSKRLVGPSPLYAAITGGAAIYSLHTAFDAAEHGTNAQLAQVLGLSQVRPLVPSALPGCSHLGQGRLGGLAQPMPFADLVAAAKRAVKSEGVQVVACAARPSAELAVQQVAVVAGAGRQLLAAAIEAGADTFVTGELPHHDALRARQAGMRVVAVRHSVSERHALPKVAQALEARFAGIPVSCSLLDADPYSFA